MAIPLAAARPALVLQITVDQLRGDMLPRLWDRMEAGGFRRLRDRGVYFSNALYDSSNTMTASGHAVLATGGWTADHGMVANEWFDRGSGGILYCVSDPRHPVVGESSRPGVGFSPANLGSGTLADEILARFAPAARVFAVAGKDRGAIIPAGKSGKAFWFGESSGGFVSSRYYFSELPAWALAWTARRPADAFRRLEWRPLAPAGATPPAANEHARPPAALGRSFPHPLLARSDVLFLGALRFTPFLDVLTADFARTLLREERLGQKGGVDFLSISFSGVDYVGHAYGPGSAEYEDALLRLDRELAGLFGLIDELVGRDRTLIALSADHGIGEIPEAMQAAGHSARRLQPKTMRATLNAGLRARFGGDQDLLAAFSPPGLYLDRAALARKGLEPTRVETALAALARTQPGVAFAYTRTELLGPMDPHDAMRARVQRGFHRDRSGDVVIVQEPYWFLYPDAESYAAMHGSPYWYDAHVPILLCGPGVPVGQAVERVSPAQLVPTLAQLLGLQPPAVTAPAGVLPGMNPDFGRDQRR